MHSLGKAAGIWAAVIRALPAHRRAFLVGAAVLNLANFLLGGPWWAFWPTLIWGVLFASHYLVYKGATIDEGWVEERTEELRQKSYDFSHIDSIKARHEGRPEWPERLSRRPPRTKPSD